DPLPEATADDAVLAAAGVRAALAVADRREAADLLARLADPDRRPDAALVADAHAALAAAVVDGRVDPADLDPPDRVRALDGSVVDVADAVVLDTPELVAVLPAGEVVVGGDPSALADLLDLPTASEIVDGEVADPGRPVLWGALPEVVVTCQALGVPVPDGELWCHDELWIVLRRPVPGRHRVPTWRAADGRRHADDAVRALLAVLALRTG
ncbi:MAG TPA: ATP-binding protein, partial [Pseudonocardia sp.]|nr:ATP-binding protein [Pseudonocardia sp.]